MAEKKITKEAQKMIDSLQLRDEEIEKIVGGADPKSWDVSEGECRICGYRKELWIQGMCKKCLEELVNSYK